MNSNIDDLRYIRSTMERSSKFLSLSGLSGVMAGLAALCGSGVAYFMLKGQISLTNNLFVDFVILALIILILALSFGIYFSYRKSKKAGASLWTPVTIQILKDTCIPLVAGGVFSLLLVYHHSSYMVASAMLIFYGIALINAGSRTYADIKILGSCEILLGIIAGILCQYGLLFWTIGFGLFHIVYGIIMYFKYDKN